ncbi:MAG: helix-turn-helix domain-containing protein [Armatimonadota bacterium]|nr:helix-turn-helix domain-containing protein [bacterium]
MINSALEGRELMQKLLSTQEAADILNVTDLTVRRWIKEGRMKAIKLGGRLWRIQESDLEAFIRSGMRRDDDE